jgi:hypothetical protein
MAEPRRHSAQEIIAHAETIRGLLGRVRAYLKNEPLEKPEVLASGIEFMLEGLYVHKKLSKAEMRGHVAYG